MDQQQPLFNVSLRCTSSSCPSHWHCKAFSRFCQWSFRVCVWGACCEGLKLSEPTWGHLRRCGILFDIGRSTRNAHVSVSGNFAGRTVRFGAKDWCDCSSGSDYSKFYACEYNMPPKPGYFLSTAFNGYVRRWQVVPQPASCSEADNTLWLQRCSSGLGSCWFGAGGVLGARGPGMHAT